MGANGASRALDRAPRRSESENGPREGLLPSGQAAGSFHFPPLLCADDSELRRAQPSAPYQLDYEQGITLARHEVRESQSRDRMIEEWHCWLCDNGSFLAAANRNSRKIRLRCIFRRTLVSIAERSQPCRRQ